MSDAIKARIAALLRKTRDAGCSEAEAMAAAAQAARLLQEHGLSRYDVEFGEAAAGLRNKTAGIRDRLWGMVAICTNCAALFKRDWTPSVLFIGRAPGPEIAAYLVEVLDRAIDREIGRFKSSPEYKRRRTLATRRAAVRDFTVGLVNRLTMRLGDLFASSLDEDMRMEAREVMNKRFPDSTPMKTKGHIVRFGSAASAGWGAGTNVQIARGVNGKDDVRLIGGEE